MKYEDFNPGIPPEDPKKEIVGLEEAIEATEKKIAHYKDKGSDVSQLEIHLKSLQSRLDLARS